MNTSLCFFRNMLLVIAGFTLSNAVASGEVKRGLAEAENGISTETSNRDEITRNSHLVIESLNQIDELAQLGMPALAVSLLNRQQKLWPAYTPDWYVFERKRISYLTAMEDWRRIVVKIDELLATAQPGKQITHRIRQWFVSQQVIARLKLGEAETALSQLRQLLWSSEEGEDSGLIALWRRLVVRGYLQLNSDSDAQKAVLRYQQDYGDDASMLNEDWRLLQARSLLRINRPRQAMELLADIDSAVAHALRLVAAIRAYPDKAKLYSEEARQQLAGKAVSQNELWAYRYVMYESAKQTQDSILAAALLQKLLSLDNSHRVLGDEFIADSDQLWELYEKQGQETGNRLKLLRGDDIAWYNAAKKMQQKNIIEALGLYTVLAFSSENEHQQQLAHQGIIDLLATDDDGLKLVSQLYMQGEHKAEVGDLPLRFRYRLLDYALSKSDISLAAAIMQSLQQPPEGEDLFAWHMRKARVLILEGAYQAGETVLAETVAERINAKSAVHTEAPEIPAAEKKDQSSLLALTADQVDRYLQVIFDLQAVQRHQQAIDLMDMIPADWLNEKLQREIYFWKAESCAALKQYDRSAWFYLKSAIIADATEAPLWAQSARFKAAGALTDAELFDDATTLYENLLRQTEAESRKALIKQELQHLRLLKNARTAQEKSQSKTRL